jgi:uncharacterized protein
MSAFFFSKGLRFSCLRCSRCCRHEPGYVFLSKQDIKRLSKGIECGIEEFIHGYCRIVQGSSGPRLSLKETDTFDCVFWVNGGCRVYDYRPLQCRSFPFWDSILVSQSIWEEHTSICPGMNKGAYHSAEEINRWLLMRVHEPLLVPTGSFPVPSD